MTLVRGVEGARPPGVARTDDRLMEACRQVEGVFLEHFTRALRDTVPNGGSADAPGAELYGSLLDEHLASIMANRGGIGMAETLYRQLGGSAPASTSGV